MSICARIGQRRRDAFVENRRPHVRELIETAPDRQQQAVQRDVIGDFRIADRSQQNRVQWTQLIESISRHHAAIPEIVFGAPVEMVKIESGIEARADCLQHLQRRRQYFFAYAITRNNGDLEAWHSLILGTGG